MITLCHIFLENPQKPYYFVLLMIKTYTIISTAVEGAPNMNVAQWFRILCWLAPAADHLLQAVFLDGLDGWGREELRPNRLERIPIA